MHACALGYMVGGEYLVYLACREYLPRGGYSRYSGSSAGRAAYGVGRYRTWLSLSLRDPVLGGVEQRIMPGWAWDGMWRMPGRYMWLVAPAGGHTAHASWPDSLALAEMAACCIYRVESSRVPTVLTLLYSTLDACKCQRRSRILYYMAATRSALLGLVQARTRAPLVPINWSRVE